MVDQSDTRGRIVIAGGTGFMGMNLARHLTADDQAVTLISRRLPRIVGPWEHMQWDGRTLGEWSHVLDGAAALVNVVGRSVDCIKSPDHCDEILRSRVESTRVLGAALRRVNKPPPVWVQMSTAHLYGDPPERVCHEDTPPGYGLAPFVGQAWEEAYSQSVLPHMRQVILRTSFVLGRGGGALPRLSKLVRWGLGGKVGHGRQGISWIHELDMSRLLTRAIVCEHMSGIYMATAPHPVSNAAFMRELRRVLRRPVGLPAAEWMVRVGAPLFMRSDPELALYGRYCVSKRLQEEGFEFLFPSLEDALSNLYKPKTYSKPKARGSGR